MAKFIDLGAIMTKKDRDANGKLQYYIKLNKELDIVINGEKLTSEYVNVDAPANKIQKRIDSGKVDEEKIEQLEKTKARYLGDGDLNYIKQQLTVVIDIDG